MPKITEINKTIARPIDWLEYKWVDATNTINPHGYEELLKPLVMKTKDISKADRRLLAKNHIRILGKINLMYVNCNFSDGLVSRPIKVDCGHSARKIISSSNPKLSIMIDFLKKIGAEEFGYRKTEQRKDIPDSLKTIFINKTEDTVMYSMHSINNYLSDFFSRIDTPDSDEWLVDTQIHYINIIINLLQQSGTHNHLEEQAMKTRCYIYGSELTPSKRRSIKLFKRWGKRASYRTVYVCDEAILQVLVPIYKIDGLNTGQFNIDTGASTVGPFGYTSKDFLKKIYFELNQYPENFNIKVLLISNDEYEKFVCIECPNLEFNDTFIQTQTLQNTFTYYRCGLVKPLPYATQPVYNLRNPTKQESSHFGLEIEVDTKYDRNYAVRDLDGKQMLPQEVLDRLNWAITKDMSIGGFELKSPIITDAIPWIDQIPEGIQRLIDATAKDARCGGHIHMSTSNVADAFFRFQFWTWLFSLIYPKRMTNEFCQIILKGAGTDYQDKRQWLRLRQKTIEFRIFPAVMKCKNIYWRLDLLKKIHLCNVNSKPSSVEDTVNIWLSNNKYAEDLRKHVLRAKEVKTIRTTLSSPLKKRWFEFESRGILSDGTPHIFTILPEKCISILDEDLRKRISANNESIPNENED